MKDNKKQRIEFVHYGIVGDINSLLENGWRIIEIYPVTPHGSSAQYGAYILLETNEETPQISENLINIFTNIGIALYDNKGEIKSLNQILKEISQKWEELTIGLK